MRNCNILTFVHCLISSFIVIINSELFTAIVDLKHLLHTEGEVVKTLEKYLEKEEQRLEKIRWLSQEYGKLHKAASFDAETFLSNPVNAYLLIKRLTADWKIAENLVNSSSSREIIENFTEQEHLKFPDDEDLNGAATALMRLQDTYLLNTTALAQGQIEGTIKSSELSGSDCFEVGYLAYNDEDYYHAALWMQEALDRIEKEDIKTASKVDALEYLAYSTYMLGNIKDAVKLTTELLLIEPNHPVLHENLPYYLKALQKVEEYKRGGNSSIPDELQTVLFSEEPNTPENEEYERLCRGECVNSPAEESKLKCQYFTNDNPFLLLQPAKEEELYLKTRIVLYHNVLSDNEMEIIKNLAMPQLRRAKVHHAEGELGYVNYRISKSAWLADEDHEVVNRVSQRIEAITGLGVETAENLQVVNYGIGGHYSTHYDMNTPYDEVDSFLARGTGNRIATWINYMSDVDAGGATVFPLIGVQVKPEKGSAAFWYNLYKNGEADMDTLHAACPVLAGSKWVSNKWFHEKGQEFRRPCSLNPDE